MSKKKLAGGWRYGGCVWCDEIMVFFDNGKDEHGFNQMLKDHVMKDCKKHPLRKLERKIKRLEKKK